MHRLAPWSLATIATLAGALASAADAPASAAPAGSAASRRAGAVLLAVRVSGGVPPQPIAGARIFIRGEGGGEIAEGRTNKLGVALLDAIPAARVRLQVTATNDWTPRGALVDVGALEAPPTVEFVLLPAAAASAGAP